MSDGKDKRPYHSAVREAAAAETRRAIVHAASELFLRQGYARTTTKAVARAAGVTERTVFLGFPSKAALLSACIRNAVRGGEEHVPLLARPEWQHALESDPDRAFRLLAEATTQLFERAAGLLAVGESTSTSDPLLEEERRRGRAATRADLLVAARALKRAGALRPGVSAQRAADAIFALAGDESLYLRLVEGCGWTPAQYAQLLEQALRGAVGTHGPAPASPPARSRPRAGD